jgi:hypothetical protein
MHDGVKAVSSTTAVNQNLAAVHAGDIACG